MALELSSLASPALHLVDSTDKTVFSKIGGLPNLPVEIEWPSNNGRAMAFLCQISMAELPPDAPLRQLLPEGCLYFFYDWEQETWGFDPADLGSWKVVHSLASPPRTVRDAPGNLDTDGIYNEKPVTFKPILSLPGDERLGGYSRRRAQRSALRGAGRTQAVDLRRTATPPNRRLPRCRSERLHGTRVRAGIQRAFLRRFFRLHRSPCRRARGRCRRMAAIAATGY